MVSLEQGSMSTGAQYMDEVLGGGTDVEPILTSTGDGFSKKLKTIPAAIIHLSISAIISFVGIAMCTLWPEEKRGEEYFIMTSLRASFWIITYVFDHFTRKRHNDLRMNGFHDFHRSITMHNGVVLMIVSAWNTILLLQAACSVQYYGTNLWNSWFTPIIGILAFQIAETFVLICTHSLYIRKVYTFNKSANYPDSMMGIDTSAGSLGLIQPGGNVAELLEKQADLIAYLKDHNQKLNQKMHQMQLNTRVSHLGH